MGKSWKLCQMRCSRSNWHEVWSHVPGKMREHFICIFPGDKIKVEFSPHDLTHGRTYLSLQMEPVRNSEMEQVGER